MFLSKNALAMCIIIAVISFLGFITENIWLAFTKGIINNRNMCFPFLLGYGLAVVLLFYLFNLPATPFFFGKKLNFSTLKAGVIFYTLAVAICISIGESILGTFVEKTCNIEWWNYSRLPLHIGKYTSVFTSLGFASLITLFMLYCFEPMYTYLMSINYSLLFFWGMLLMTLMISDFLYSAYLMYKNKALTQRWSINITLFGGGH